MRVQPLMKEIQDKYKSDPQRLQQEMVKLYREHKINPLGGCLPMLLPFPILIALFFVFRDTIEFRGVPFLWLPDLSRPDPYYIVPLLMGASIFLLQWISQRMMPQSNPQMPVMLVVLFLNFASGLNLYYATMNVASLPQQLYLAKERRAAASQPAPAKAKS
jgi:YidC/Oxa1 family membrane protein insertase